MFVYQQKTGGLHRDGQLIAVGYSGAGVSIEAGRNNPAMEGKKSIGPIPRGNYTIGKAFTHASKGPLCMRITPNGHNALGRSGFLFHGNNKENNASEGCIIMPPNVRKLIAESGDTALSVVA
jgi:Protein of unknown function (DUF2778)